VKKVSAILLSSLLFFNWYGYRLLTDLMQNKASNRLEAKLDKDQYDPSQLIEIRVPINLPYHNDWDQFERFKGEIELNGIHYSYVKRKVEKGELVLLCLPNSEKQMLSSARDQFFKLVNDLQQPSNGKNADKGNQISVKNVLSDYDQDNHQWSLTYPEPISYIDSHNYREDVNSCFHGSPEQPPELNHSA
jgi:hypothetical protein